MGFWLRHIIFGLVLIGLAIFLIVNQDEIFSESLNSNTQSAKNADPKNKAAEGLSSFYASINPDIDKESGPMIRNNVVYLPKPSGDLDSMLSDRSQVVRPTNKRWKGSEKSRPFRKGETLFQKLSEYANDEGMEIYWRLDKDFLVKDAFRVEKSILDTAAHVGQAVSGHFVHGVFVYFCHNQRAIIFTDTDTEFLKNECQHIEIESK